MAIRAAILAVQRIRGRTEPGGPGELPGEHPITD
jgi:hypothetical protein